jgi:hypothetical protein
MRRGQIWHRKRLTQGFDTEHAWLWAEDWEPQAVPWPHRSQIIRLLLQRVLQATPQEGRRLIYHLHKGCSWPPDEQSDRGPEG